MNPVTAKQAQSYGDYVAAMVRAGNGYFTFERWANMIADLEASETMPDTGWTQVAGPERVPEVAR